MGYGETLVAVLDPAQQEDVDVDRPRGVTAWVRAAAELALDGLAGVEERRGLETGLDLETRVEEVVLAGGFVLRLGLVGTRGGQNADVGPRVEAVARRPQARPPVAGVRAEPQEAATGRAAEAQSARSLTTSTATSFTGSGIGGSALAARTETWSAP